MITSLRIKLYEERLMRNVAFEEINEEMLKEFTNVDANKLFLIEDLSRMRNNGLIVICKQIQLDYTRFLFTNNVVRGWNNLPPSVMQCFNKLL